MNTRLYSSLWAGLATAMLAVVGWSGCSSPNTDKSLLSGTPPSASNTLENRVTMDRPAVSMSGIRWTRWPLADTTGESTLHGEWTLHPEHRSAIAAPGSGRIVRLHYRLNQQVAPGALLAEVESRDFIHLQQSWLETYRQWIFADQEYQRTADLLQGQATSVREEEKARSDRDALRAALDGMSAELRLFHIDTLSLLQRGPQPAYGIRALLGGTVLRSEASPGQWLEAGTVLGETGDLKRMHADLFLYPAQSGRLQPGDTLSVQTTGLAGEISVVVQHADRQVEEASGAFRVHAVPVSIGPVPPAGAFLEARLMTGPAPDAVLVPASAVRRIGEQRVIYVHEADADDGKTVVFRRIGATVLREDARGTWIRPEEPLSPGMEIVTHGAYYIEAAETVHEFGEE